MSLLVFFFLASVHQCSCLQTVSTLPARVSPTVVQGTKNAVCPSLEVISERRNVMKREIRDLLQNTVNPELTNQFYSPPCSCGGPGEWTRIAFLNMTDPSQQCPTNWNLITSPVRACGRSSTGANTCDSAFFPSNGHSYSHVCGRIIGFQQGSTDAFRASILDTTTGLGNAYMDGVSLTHGAAGSRQHIWSFVSALYENDSYRLSTKNTCPCTGTKATWPHRIPSFVGNNYLCDTGNTGPGYNLTTVYADDPLWDGQGCASTSTCCQFNNPPWICTTLPEQTSDDIEFRICGDYPRDTDEDTLVNFIDFYIQ